VEGGCWTLIAGHEKSLRKRCCGRLNSQCVPEVAAIINASNDGVSKHMICLETVSRRGFSCLGVGSVMSCLDFVSSFHVSSCVMTVSWLVSVSGITKCLFCAETLAFLAESRPLGAFTRSLLTYCKTFISLKILTAIQSCLSLIFNVLACLVSWHLCFDKCLCLGKMYWLRHWSLSWSSIINVVIKR